MYSHVACDVIKEQTLYLLKPSSLIWHLMPYLFLYIPSSASKDTQIAHTVIFKLVSFNCKNIYSTKKVKENVFEGL